jgi:hypothetical protein
MVQDDFNSSFRKQLAGEMLMAHDPHYIAMRIIHRDLRRTRVLAGLSLFFWLVGATGMLLLVLGLNRLVIFLRIADGLPWSFNGKTMAASPGFASSGQEQMFWGTNLIHHGIPFIEASIVALALAALFTVMLVMSSYRATLNRINFSLAQIAEQLKQSPAPGGSAASPAPQIYQEKTRSGLWIVLGAVALLVVVFGIVFLTGRFWPGDRAWQGYPRLSPFEAIRWHDQTPQVRVGGNWYELLAINDVPTSEIVAFSQFKGPDTWQKHFEEDLVELMIRMGHDPGASATLKVKELSSGNVGVLKDVPMTEQNRTSLWQARWNASSQP